MSLNSKSGGAATASKMSDDDSKTAVKVGRDGAISTRSCAQSLTPALQQYEYDRLYSLQILASISYLRAFVVRRAKYRLRQI